MSGLKIKPRDSDFILGVNSPLRADKVLVSGDWLPYFKFYERQLISDTDTDGCVLFSCQEVFDAWIEFLRETKKIDDKTWNWFDSLGYLDGGFFHSSPRFLQIKTGNGFNGNSVPEGVDVMRTYGVLPWKDLPATKDLTRADYLTGLTPEMENKAIQFLAGIGGKNSIQYHWILNGAGDMQAMQDALQSSPLVVGVNVGTNWNQEQPTPPSSGANPGHAVSNFLVNPLNDAHIYDHYLPNPKELINYPIWYALQIIVSVNPPPPAPSLPPNPTVPQTVSWLTSLVSWIRNIVEGITPSGRAKLGGASRSPLWEQTKREYFKTHLKICAGCGTVKGIQVHHIKDFSDFPEDELKPKNFLLLCENTTQNCHINIGHSGNFKSINPNSVADAKANLERFRNRPMGHQAILDSFSKVANSPNK